VAKRRILLVDDEVTVLLTMKAVLELSGFEVETAASAKEARSKIRTHEYQMIITDMRMESEAAGREVIQAARNAAYHPAIALLTAYPEDDFGDVTADQVLVKARQTAMLLADIEALLASHAAKLQRLAVAAGAAATTAPTAAPAKKAPTKKSAAKRLASKKLTPKKVIARKKAATKKRKR
jgi:DNA-binding response OmpR family regulator